MPNQWLRSELYERKKAVGPLIQPELGGVAGIESKQVVGMVYIEKKSSEASHLLW